MEEDEGGDPGEDRLQGEDEGGVGGGEMLLGPALDGEGGGGGEDGGDRKRGEEAGGEVEGEVASEREGDEQDKGTEANLEGAEEAGVDVRGSLGEG